MFAALPISPAPAVAGTARVPLAVLPGLGRDCDCVSAADGDGGGLALVPNTDTDHSSVADRADAVLEVARARPALTAVAAAAATHREESHHTPASTH